MNNIWNKNLGEAIAFEDVMSLMTVIFVVFFIIMIPLVNLEKARLERASVDPFWETRVSKVLETKESSPDAWKYRTPFNIESTTVLVTPVNDSITYIEAADNQGLLVVIQHNVSKNLFRSMRVDSKGGSLNFLRGIFSYSSGAGEYFREILESSYGEHPFAQTLETDYREWISNP